MSTPAPLRFHVSDVRVELRCALEPALRGMRAVWGSCEHALLPPQREARLQVSAEASGEYRVVAVDDHEDDGDAAQRGDADASANAAAHGRVRRTARAEDVLPLLEASLYEAMTRWHRGRVVLHAACLALSDAPVLLLGRSGAGKSSLALAALAAGWGYLGDELALTDGRRLWGVPRAVQLSPCRDEERLPPWAAALDRESYRLRVEGDALGALPLRRPPPAQVLRAPCGLERLRLVFLDPGARAPGLEAGRAAGPELEALSPLAALALLHEACFAVPSLDLGPLVRPGACARLVWREPAAAIRLLSDWISRG